MSRTRHHSLKHGTPKQGEGTDNRSPWCEFNEKRYHHGKDIDLPRKYIKSMTSRAERRISRRALTVLVPISETELRQIWNAEDALSPPDWWAMHAQAYWDEYCGNLDAISNTKDCK
jgi:hypothetical protein